jgi:radical SAM protein with 4Fe4S-binding SPASM domain
MIYQSDGTMVPCCYDKIPEFPMGTSEKEKGDLWKSPQMQNFRKQVLTNISSITICKNCI